MSDEIFTSTTISEETTFPQETEYPEDPYIPDCWEDIYFDPRSFKLGIYAGVQVITLFLAIAALNRRKWSGPTAFTVQILWSISCGIWIALAVQESKSSMQNLIILYAIFDILSKGFLCYFLPYRLLKQISQNINAGGSAKNQANLKVKVILAFLFVSFVIIRVIHSWFLFSRLAQNYENQNQENDHSNDQDAGDGEDHDLHSDHNLQEKGAMNLVFNLVGTFYLLIDFLLSMGQLYTLFTCLKIRYQIQGGVLQVFKKMEEINIHGIIKYISTLTLFNAFHICAYFLEYDVDEMLYASIASIRFTLFCQLTDLFSDSIITAPSPISGVFSSFKQSKGKDATEKLEERKTNWFDEN